MAEGKYGRLFTEDDVRRILETVAVEEFRPFVAGAWQQLLACELDTTFPADEPLFLLRAQDLAAPDAIADGPLCYEDECQIRGASRDYRDAVRERAREMRRWQAAHPDRVKVPD